MIRKVLLSISFVLLAAFTSLPAQDVYVDYLEGYLEVQSGSGWDLIDIGDFIADDQTIRLTDNSYAELIFRDIKITLDKDGVYEIQSLLSRFEKADKWGIKGTAIAKIFRDDTLESRQSNAVMGVRGDPMDEETITWMDDDTEFLREGKNLYLAGNFEKALVQLEEGADWYGSNYDEILLYKALCEYELGFPREMKRTLMEMNPSEDKNFYGTYVLMLGNVFIENAQYNEADNLFIQYIENAENRDDLQLVLFLSAFCSIEMGDVDIAREKLNSAVKIDSTNQTGINATKVLETL